MSGATRVTLHVTFCRAVLALFALPLALASYAGAIPAGKSTLAIDVDGTPIEVFTYKPEGYAGGGVLLTLHGVGRNASGYRDYAVPLADRHRLLVVVPLFDRQRFPSWRYQHGGVRRPSRQQEGETLRVEAEAQWTGHIFVKIVERVRAMDGTPQAPWYLLGHSAGAQALSRVAGLMHTGAERIVLANAGSYLWPGSAMRFPDGYAGLPQPWAAEESLRRYLAQPITLLLGTADVKQDPDLPQRESLAAQGANRYERGWNAYRTAQKLAADRGWAFKWKVIEVPGVGHSARRMLASQEAAASLKP